MSEPDAYDAEQKPIRSASMSIDADGNLSLRMFLPERPTRSSSQYLSPIPYPLRIGRLCSPDFGVCGNGLVGFICGCAIARENHDPGDEDDVQLAIARIQSAIRDRVMAVLLEEPRPPKVPFSIGGET